MLVIGERGVNRIRGAGKWFYKLKKRADLASDF
jgi:hypothetical protein